jgi:hypothetical protein
VRRPVANWTLRNIYRGAVANGYVAGENVFGGAYFVSADCLARLREAGFLPDYRLRNAYLQEDHLFSLLVKAIDLDFGDLATGDLPFACRWSGLPDSPTNLVGKRKKVVHSTRYWGDMTEDEIRSFFRAQRHC